MSDYVTCHATGKRRFPSKAEAREALGGSLRRVPNRRRKRVTGTGVPFETYRCPDCGGWHNTSRPKRKHGLKRFQ